MKGIFLTKRHLLFFIINLLMVTFFVFVLINLNNGKNNELPWDLIKISVLISIPVIFFQYPLLNLRKNWLYKSLVFYLSMITFLFLFGVVSAWNEKVGDSAAGSWLARIDSGIRMIIFGQVFGGIIGFVPILIINRLLNAKLFLER